MMSRDVSVVDACPVAGVAGVAKCGTLARVSNTVIPRVEPLPGGDRRRPCIGCGAVTTPRLVVVVGDRWPEGTFGHEGGESIVVCRSPMACAQRRPLPAWWTELQKSGEEANT
jgi:hypothetical protein